MSRRTVGIVLIIVGALVFVWATSQISSLPPAMFTPAQLQDSLIHGPRTMYRISQVLGGIGAIAGGVLLFQKG